MKVSNLFMKRIGTDALVVSRLAQSIFIKSENVRIFNSDDSTLAIELNSGKSQIFDPWEKNLYMACNGLDNCAQIIDNLGLDLNHGYRLFEELWQNGFIKVVGQAAVTLNNSGSDICDCAPEEKLPSEVIFDAAELRDDCLEDAEEVWFKRGCVHFGNSDSIEVSGAKFAPLFYFKHISWRKHSEFIDNLLEKWLQECDCELGVNRDKKDFLPSFNIVLDTEEIPKGAGFVNYCQGCASASRLCTWDRLSALGKLWCKLHVLNAEIIWRFPFDKLLDNRSSAFSACFTEKPIAAPRLSEAAEVAAMLFDTSGKIYNLPKGCCGHFPMIGISILPVVQIVNAEQLQQIWPLFQQSGYSAFGFTLAEKLLQENSAELESALVEGSKLCSTVDGLTIFPFTRWLQDLQGTIPRYESRQKALQRCQGRPWFKNKCRRCPNWHFCTDSNHSQPPLPCSFMSNWAPEFLRRIVKAQAANKKIENL